jgi:hypothetical protein
MHRLRRAVVTAFVAGIILGCGGESQPNAPASPENMTPDFGAQSGDMMKNANTGMDPKKAKLPAHPAKN